MSITPLNEIIFEIRYNEWKFIFLQSENSIIINAQKSKVYKIYEKILTLNDFLKYSSNSDISKYSLLEQLNSLFIENKIKLKEDKDDLILSFENNHINQKLILNNKENIDSFILLEYIKLNSKKLNEKEIPSLNNKINFQKLNSEIKKKKIITNFNPTKIKAHNSFISLISIFPCGNLISVSCDDSIKIWTNNLKLIQSIIKAHLNWIYYVDIKDNNTFVTSSVDRNIKIWKKKENEFQLFSCINNAHNSYITKTIFNNMNDNIISCSGDEKIKIWEFKDNFNIYQNITTLNFGYGLYSILILNDLNLLIASGKIGTKFYNIYNFELICYIEESKCGNWNCLSRIDNNRLIMGESFYIYVVLINEKKVSQKIEINIKCSTVYVLNNYNVFLCGGNSQDFLIYSTDDYKCIQTINGKHTSFINGFLLINNNQLLSYSDDFTINIWEI